MFPSRSSKGKRRLLPVFLLLALGVVGALIAVAGFVLSGHNAVAAQQAPAGVACTLVVPANPTSARGLSTPYRLRAGCHEGDDGATAFVEATVLDPATGQLSVYAPLVIDDRTRPAAAPVVPKLPARAVVGIWFGFNGDDLTLAGAGAGACVNGSNGSIFGQFAYCNAQAFFAAANAAVRAGKLKIPAVGTASDGKPCPTTRDFSIVDQDQSDNVTSSYLALPDGRTAQNTAANRAALAARGARIEVNGSDNGLVVAHVDPALGCTPYRAPDLADPGAMATSLALNELQAAADQAAPVALVPTNDPMTLVNGRASTRKTNLYRAGVDMPPVNTATETPAAYCRQMLSLGAGRAELDKAAFAAADSPDPGAANSLFTFLAARLSGSFDDLGCATLMRAANPVHLVVDGDGVATDATFGAGGGGPAPSGSATPTATPAATPTATPAGRPGRPPRHSGAPVPPTGTATPSVTASVVQ